MSKTFVGIDVSSQWFDVAVTPGDLSWRVSYTDSSLVPFVQRLHALDVTLVVLEACGHLERPLARVLDRAGIPVAVVNPRICGVGSSFLASTSRTI